ncbi:low molecular weight phosphotyrosine protein phosphatase [Elysia marginata]|uniref:Low molecular weight phosphotyrosine protein phosphatase n=1 Tax=Elysia marginata TaxID=1093978 RepID=A0AAV4GZZ6_9GAST|nr:low molecular weight phosphotyrosine protein phosphatase [Elysia marginata]
MVVVVVLVVVVVIIVVVIVVVAVVTEVAVVVVIVVVVVSSSSSSSRNSSSNRSSRSGGSSSGSGSTSIITNTVIVLKVVVAVVVVVVVVEISAVLWAKQTRNRATPYKPSWRTGSFLTILMSGPKMVHDITKDDFKNFEYIFGMDHENMEDIGEMKPKGGTAKCMLLGEYDPQKELTVQDPYFTHGQNKNAFNEVYDQCHRCCVAFLDSLNL